MCYFLGIYTDIRDYSGVAIADGVVDTKVEYATTNINLVTLDWINTVLNLTVNIVATLLIAFRAW